MITNQIMKRDFNGEKISQRTLDGFFNASELLHIYNQTSDPKKRLPDFWANQNVQSFVKELEKDIIHNVGICPQLKTHDTKRGKNGSTWMHPYLFIRFAMWISPKFELQVIKWVHDNLIDFRNQSGDFYKEMCYEIKEYYIRNENKEKIDPLIFIEEAKMINFLCYNNQLCGKRNILSEKELKLLNDLQRLNIKMLKINRTKTDRRKTLSEYANNYKMINF